MNLKKITNNHIIMSGLYKGMSGLSLFVSIPLLISFLGKEDYGVWVLVFTLFQFVLLMDFGIQSSLKTKIPILLNENKIELLKSYIKTTYFISFLLALFVLAFSFIVIYNIDINKILNINFHSISFIRQLFMLNILFFCLNFIANIHKSLYVAFLKGKYAEESIALYQVGFLVLVFVAIIYFPNISIENKLYLVTFLNGGFCLIINLLYTFRFFKLEKINLSTKEKLPTNFIKDLLVLGLKFMVIQLGVLFIFSVDNYLVSNIFSPNEVVAYDSINKLFQLPILIIFAGLSPLWSMFAKDYLDQNKSKLKATFKKFNQFSVILTFGLIFFAILTPFIVKIWLKSTIEIPQYLITLTAIVTLFRIITSFYTFFLNGIGQLNTYIVILIISVLIKVPLTYFLISLNLGINSVMLSTLIILLIWLITLPLQSYKIVNSIKLNEK